MYDVLILDGHIMLPFSHSSTPFFDSSVTRRRGTSRRSTNPLSSSRPSSALEASFERSVNLLSPVPLKGDDDDLIYTSGISFSNQTFAASRSFHHVPTAPVLASSNLVRRCILAVCSSLPTSVADAFRSKWLVARNAPGPDTLSPRREWALFVRVLLSQMGLPSACELSSVTPSGLCVLVTASVTSTSPPAKKCRNDQPTDSDWSFLLKSDTNLDSGERLDALLGLTPIVDELQSIMKSEPRPDYTAQRSVDVEAPLFGHIRSVLVALHEMYEEGKLDKTKFDGQAFLAQLLVHLSTDLGLDKFKQHYSRDFPHLLWCRGVSLISQHSRPTNERLSSQMAGLALQDPGEIVRYRKLDDSTKLTRVGIAALCKIAFSKEKQMLWRELEKDLSGSKLDETFWSSEVSASERCSQLVRLFPACDFNMRRLKTIPDRILLPVKAAISVVRRTATRDLSQTEALLTGRSDLTQFGSSLKIRVSGGKVESCMWPRDLRLGDVRCMLQSDGPVPVSVQQRFNMTDHEFLEEQERQLLTLCVRTMALPIGRGALDLFSTNPLASDKLASPELCLTGQSTSRGTVVELEHIDLAPNMDKWPLFHNGVASGLRLAKDSKYINSSWILFNKPHEPYAYNALIEHGGFLFALGLSGHMKELGRLNSFEYITDGHELLSIGFILGLGAAKRGSMDVMATKTVATQLVALLPTSSIELPIQQSTQIAGLMSLGLLYQGTGHRQMIEVCLSELGRSPDHDVCQDRESYSLTAGLALGMIGFGLGNSLVFGSLKDLSLHDVLYYCMVGGPCSPKTPFHKKESLSNHTFPSEVINVDITSPGATLALGMLFFDTGNVSVANWMDIPQTERLLETIRPDFLMLRTFAKGLIMWRKIRPSKEWIDSNVPANFLPHCLVRPVSSSGATIDYETINQAYCNIISGAALIMGLRFAGSKNQAAFNVIMEKTKMLMAICNRSIGELTGRATVEQAICVHVLAMAIVMAGSGDLDATCLIRYLRSRIGPKYPTVTYGSHMALHMALGLLYLGGGKLTLSTEPLAVAAMVVAFYPKFPTHSNDNRYHLQALRHLYVLAVESRLLRPVDDVRGRHLKTMITLRLKDTDFYRDVSLRLLAPTILPEFKYIASVCVDDDSVYGNELSESDLHDVCGRRGALVVKRRPQWHRLCQSGHAGHALFGEAAGAAFHDTFEETLAFDLTLKKLWFVFAKWSRCHEETKRLLRYFIINCIQNDSMEMLSFFLDNTKLLSLGPSGMHTAQPSLLVKALGSLEAMTCSTTSELQTGLMQAALAMALKREWTASVPKYNSVNRLMKDARNRVIGNPLRCLSTLDL